jgi:hypothetical protein
LKCFQLGFEVPSMEAQPVGLPHGVSHNPKSGLMFHYRLEPFLLLPRDSFGSAALAKVVQDVQKAFGLCGFPTSTSTTNVQNQYFLHTL